MMIYLNTRIRPRNKNLEPIYHQNQYSEMVMENVVLEGVRKMYLQEFFRVQESVVF